MIIGIRKKFPRLQDSELPSATVIVAARNEERNIGECLNALAALEYPEGKLQFIIVNDQSTDRTEEIIDAFIKDKPIFKKINTTEEQNRLKGKTRALAQALREVNTDIVLTTDADCVVPPTWAKSMASYYTKGVGVVSGCTAQRYNNAFEGMQSLDFIYLLALGSGTINNGYPISCIGNNMSYSVNAYKAIGGYESLPFSVTEDSQLLLALTRLPGVKSIHPLDYQTLVVSKPLSSIKELFRQKKRWAIGGLDVPFYGKILMGAGWTISAAMLLFPFFYSPVTFSLFFFKFIIDVIFLSLVCNELRFKVPLKYFVVFELYYIIYIFILLFAILINKNVVWKDRKF